MTPKLDVSERMCSARFLFAESFTLVCFYLGEHQNMSPSTGRLQDFIPLCHHIPTSSCFVWVSHGAWIVNREESALVHMLLVSAANALGSFRQVIISQPLPAAIEG